MPSPDHDFEDDEGEGEGGGTLRGQRIFVLSLQGNTLQTLTVLQEGQHFEDICCFDGKLLVSHWEAFPVSGIRCGLLVFRGV